MSNYICSWSCFLPPSPRAVSGPGAAGVPKAAGWELLPEAGGLSMSPPCWCQPDPQAPLVVPRHCMWLEVWDGTRTPVGAGTLRDKIALLSLSCWLFMNGVSLSPGLTYSQREQFWDETVGLDHSRDVPWLVSSCPCGTWGCVCESRTVPPSCPS